ncbi:MAG: ferrochelatase [Elusimicrobia bacterium]|nr:ferrochelatase [Elusimicrobiota bacterium]
MNYDAVLLMAYGGPTRLEEVRPFLENATRGHSIPPKRIQTVREQYQAIGGSSPLNEITFQQARALETQLRAKGRPLKVYVGMRNWNPSLQETLQKMRRDGIQKSLGIILSPYKCEASWDRYIAAVEDARNKIGSDSPVIDFADPWQDRPLFQSALEDRIRNRISADVRETCHWIFTAHSIPVSMDEKSGYSKQIRKTAQILSERFSKKNWNVAYTSRSGRPQDPWLEPDINDLLTELSRQKVSSVLVIPIGFVADHVEVLYDLDIRAKKRADDLNIQFFRVPTVMDHPFFIQMLAELVL